ncbi:MAG: hypothetical protein V8T12_05305 [Parabacteroides johnsonii]
MKWLLPALFIVYYSSISLFMHVHVEDGTTIVHSHPFKKTADGTCHHHSSLSEIQLFHLLTTVHVQDGAICSLLLQFYATPSYKIIENRPAWIIRSLFWGNCLSASLLLLLSDQDGICPSVGG